MAAISPIKEGQILTGPKKKKGQAIFLEFCGASRVAEDRRDCYWLYVVTHCKTKPNLQDPIKDPARLDWHEVKKVDHYYLSVDAVTGPMTVSEGGPPAYGEPTP